MVMLFAASSTHSSDAAIHKVWLYGIANSARLHSTAPIRK